MATKSTMQRIAVVPRHPSADDAAWLVVRLGLGAVMIWFGVQELLDPGAWVVFVPAVLSSLTPVLLPAHGLALLASGTFLFFGLHTRAAALLATLVLGGVLVALAVDGAVDSVFVRDVGLIAGSLGLGLAREPASAFSLDRWRAGSPRAVSLGFAVAVVALAAVLVVRAVPSGPRDSSFEHLGGAIGSGGIAFTAPPRSP